MFAISVYSVRVDLLKIKYNVFAMICLKYDPVIGHYYWHIGLFSVLRCILLLSCMVIYYTVIFS